VARIVVVGEGMLELTGTDEGWRLGYGGDTLNTAIHLARRGHTVALLTALGSDRFSHRLREAWIAEGLDAALILTHPTRHAGLYAIALDERGERSFTYWREASAAREMFELPGAEAALREAQGADLLYFSLISLAILPATGRERLFSLAAGMRARGGKVAFDGNYRPALWSGPEEASRARDAAIAHADIGLPTFADEAALSGATSPQAVVARWRDGGCAETMVKLGEEGCLLPDGRTIPAKPIERPVDTSGAGDAFNAGYLDGRINGLTSVEAARAGNRLAAWTIQRPGAIPPQDKDSPGSL
jgi:2-dehydro-3-deoxygluconokinase